MEDIKYLLGYNDDNHDTMFWFDGECVGDDEFDLAIEMFNIGKMTDLTTEIRTVYIDLESFGNAELTEDEAEILHNYLCFRDLIDTDVWNALTQEDYRTAIVIIKDKKLTEFDTEE